MLLVVVPRDWASAKPGAATSKHRAAQAPRTTLLRVRTSADITNKLRFMVFASGRSSGTHNIVGCHVRLDGRR
jgi:hypothetical protein